MSKCPKLHGDSAWYFCNFEEDHKGDCSFWMQELDVKKLVSIAKNPLASKSEGFDVASDPAPAEGQRMTEVTKLLQSFCNGGHPIEAAQRWLRDERRAQEQGEMPPVCVKDGRWAAGESPAPPTELRFQATPGSFQLEAGPPTELERCRAALENMTIARDAWHKSSDAHYDELQRCKTALREIRARADEPVHTVVEAFQYVDDIRAALAKAGVTLNQSAVAAPKMCTACGDAEPCDCMDP